MKITIDQRTLYNALKPVTVMTGDVRVQLNQEKLEIRAVDETNIGSVAMSLESSAFEEYTPEGLQLCVDVNRIVHLLERIGSVGDVTLELSEREELKLYAGRYEFDLALLAAEAVQDNRVPRELAYHSLVRIRREDLEDTFKVADMFGDTVALGVDPEYDIFYINAVGDTDSMSSTFDKQQLLGIESGKSRAVLSLEFLKDMVSPVPSDTEIRLRLGREVPVEFNYHFADDDGRVEYLLAPRIEG